MKVLTAAQMREVDRQTIELGIPGLVLMENAGHRVVEVLDEQFAPLSDHHVVVLCGKGNNGGDGFVVARQLHTRLQPARLDVVFPDDPATLKGDAAANYRMLLACGCRVDDEISDEMRGATLVLDALLGTGLTGPARGPTADLIGEINRGFPGARVVAVDLPSGLASDSGEIPGEAVRADFSVTFTAPKICQLLPPASDLVGELEVGEIGSPPELYEDDEEIWFAVNDPELFADLLEERQPGGHKGTYGHALVVGGSRGKTGAAAMAGMAALRAGAGLVTVATAESALPVVASHSPEVMTEALPETGDGAISTKAFDYGKIGAIVAGKAVLAIGPGLGTDPETVDFVRRAVADVELPTVIDADGLNALPAEFTGRPSMVLTPHPGEMGRLCGKTTAEVMSDRLSVARSYAMEREVMLVLKGQRTLVAAPDGRVWVNLTGTPALGTGGTGDILTGLIAGLIAQFPDQVEEAVLAAVWLHGLAGELGAAEIGEQGLIASDLLSYLPEAIESARKLSDDV
jgi:ADP-dependent NAD(P)H-hydrate dehydratase / NAD(P)H-hydrate epimerase